MNIYVRNLRNIKSVNKEFENKDVEFIRVDRNSVLGNPFYLKDKNDKDERMFVIEQYALYFDNQVRNSQSAFKNELDRINSILQEKDVVLLCWCYPDNCHADVIKEYLKKRNKM